ncbi:hypothetical protein [Halobaculum roseum]|uniref:Uncharacterized protein n=1 Tax=Halobaculum roseum TaxID=2175149 RepID=A0ABD5MTG8_9EURY|nr:hypothetical protein [Halobaculum roseum]QZY02105.1 hypothetical protein K6T36_12425 [Halobaculum roseum]
MGSEPSTESTSAGDRNTNDACAPHRRPYAVATLLRDWVVAVAVVAGLYGLLYAIPVPPFGVPGYLLIVAFDRLETVLPAFSSSTAYDAAFAGFLGTLAVVASLGASWSRSRGAAGGRSVAAGAAVTVVGVVGAALWSTVFLRFAGGDYTPLLVVGATTVLLLFAGRYLAVGRFGRRLA